MRRAERRRAEQEGRTPRSLWEIDYLLLLDDEVRQGALRFALCALRFAARAGGTFLASGHTLFAFRPFSICHDSFWPPEG